MNRKKAEKKMLPITNVEDVKWMFSSVSEVQGASHCMTILYGFPLFRVMYSLSSHQNHFNGKHKSNSKVNKFETTNMIKVDVNNNEASAWFFEGGSCDKINEITLAIIHLKIYKYWVELVWNVLIHIYSNSFIAF